MAAVKATHWSLEETLTLFNYILDNIEDYIKAKSIRKLIPYFETGFFSTPDRTGLQRLTRVENCQRQYRKAIRDAEILKQLTGDNSTNVEELCIKVEPGDTNGTTTYGPEMQVFKSHELFLLCQEYDKKVPKSGSTHIQDTTFALVRRAREQSLGLKRPAASCAAGVVFKRPTEHPFPRPITAAVRLPPPQQPVAAAASNPLQFKQSSSSSRNQTDILADLLDAQRKNVNTLEKINNNITQLNTNIVCLLQYYQQQRPLCPAQVIPTISGSSQVIPHQDHEDAVYYEEDQ